MLLVATAVQTAQAQAPYGQQSWDAVPIAIETFNHVDPARHALVECTAASASCATPQSYHSSG